jgi:transcriptional regulator with XRE-family HTH domain
MEELKRLRKARGLSQAKLAALADLDPSTVSQIETGARRANTRTLERLAEALGAEVGDLFPKAQAALPLESDYGVLLKERGFPSEQIAAYLAQSKRDEEFIRRGLEKMSAQEFRKALLSSPGFRRMREYYRKADTETDASPRSESA